MTLKEITKLEDKAKEVWVVSPSLHFDVENKIFSEIVSVNLGQKTKYRYIVPANKTIKTNIEKYKKAYNVTEVDIVKMFCFIQESDFTFFLNELAIYNGSSSAPVSVSTPALEDSKEAIKYSLETTKIQVKSFKEIWKKYKRENL